MPNQPKTKARAFRIPDELWERVVVAAQVEAVTQTAIVNRALDAYLTAKEKP